MPERTIDVTAGCFVANSFEREIRRFCSGRRIPIHISKVSGFLEKTFFITINSSQENINLVIRAIKSIEQ